MMADCTLVVEIDPTLEPLVHRVATTLDRACLDEPLTQLVMALQRRQCLELETTSTGTGPLRVRLKPFVELALREAADIGADARLDNATKTRRIAETFALCGL